MTQRWKVDGRGGAPKYIYIFLSRSVGLLGGGGKGRGYMGGKTWQCYEGFVEHEACIPVVKVRPIRPAMCCYLIVTRSPDTQIKKHFKRCLQEGNKMSYQQSSLQILHGTQRTT